jgi:hypothetical protein
VTTSDRRKPAFDDDYQHELRSSYFGSPLNSPASENYAIGVLDTGSGVDIVAGTAAETLGVTGQHVTSNAIPLSGVGGGSVDAYVTWPLGFFVAGFSAINSNGILDLTSVVGHTSVAGLAAPAILCEEQEIVSALIGTNLIAFFNTVIRLDTPRTILYNGEEVTSPDVRVQDVFDPLPNHSRFISIDVVGLTPVLTATYYPAIIPDPKEPDDSPEFPTQLSLGPGAIPFGAWFFATIALREGEPSPDNVAQDFELLVDTGAQTSIISEGVAADLSLPLQPDFTVDICGVGGVLEDVPGYYIDFAKINASGGALEFSRAPFVVLDLTSPAGGPLDGILGMNFFWNRNITIEPSLTASSFITVSDPVPFAGGDFDLDMDVDEQDAAGLAVCSAGPATDTLSPDCEHIDVDLDLDIDLQDYAWLQTCYSGHGLPADTTCGP